MNIFFIIPKVIFIRFYWKKNIKLALVRLRANYLWNIGSIRSPYILYSNAWSSRPKAVDTFLNAEISGAAMIEGIAILNKKGYAVR